VARRCQAAAVAARSLSVLAEQQRKRGSEQQQRQQALKHAREHRHLVF